MLNINKSVESSLPQNSSKLRIAAVWLCAMSKRASTVACSMVCQKKEKVVFYLFNDSVVSTLFGNLEVLVMYIADGDGIAAKVHHKLAVTQYAYHITFLSS